MFCWQRRGSSTFQAGEFTFELSEGNVAVINAERLPGVILELSLKETESELVIATNKSLL